MKILPLFKENAIKTWIFLLQLYNNVKEETATRKKLATYFRHSQHLFYPYYFDKNLVPKVIIIWRNGQHTGLFFFFRETDQDIPYGYFFLRFQT